MTLVALSPTDIAYLESRGLTVADVDHQVARLRHPPLPVALERPCTVGDGIVRLDPSDEDRLLGRGAAAADAGRVTKFVPASGAATRMFAELIAALQSASRPSELPAAREFFAHLDEFPFTAELRQRARIAGAPSNDTEERQLLATMLRDMRFAELPKALIPFHRGSEVRSALVEHLLEATRYARAEDGTCRLHFTVSPESRPAFEAALRAAITDVERTRPSALDVSLSEQHPSTDTVAIDPSGQIFRQQDGTILLRPSGHGALLTNLEQLSADIVVIKNIDNVLPDDASDEAIRWKRLLIGYLAEIEAEVFARLDRCSESDCPVAALDEAIAFAGRFARRPLRPLTEPDAKREFVFEALDRPLRVCGVVRNQGEPGGAPFWTRHSDDGHSIQIVESSQVNRRNTEQAAIFERSTHFNPVDLVCGLRSWRGDAHHLARFVDENTAFISDKTFDGRPLRTLERPGLWNGSMAGWNTVCVEVPESTFAPVKTVFDLLRPQHQP